MTETSNIRMERIEKLLRELEYEVTRGMMEREIEEEIAFRFLVANSARVLGGVVFCEFRTRPVTHFEAAFGGGRLESRLKLVKG